MILQLKHSQEPLLLLEQLLSLFTATDNHAETNTTTFDFVVRANTAPTFNPTPIVD
jgi:hypothetical protein